MKDSSAARAKGKQKVRDLALPGPERFSEAAGSGWNDGPRGEGSVGYRIAAMVAMLLLALAGVLFWFFGRR
jgi:hypothetical protein